MDRLLVERTVTERMFSRNVSILESLLKANAASERIIERHLQELNACWIALQKSHDLYIVTCFTDAIDIEENDLYLETFTRKYIDVEAACDNFTRNKKDCCDRKATGERENSIKLERIKFRIFDGDVRKYPKFKSDFTKFVAPLCSNYQMAFVLKSYLCESVRREIENIDHSIDSIWNRLDEKYGAVHKLIDCVLSDIKGLPNCKDSSSSLEMIRLIERAHSDLECIDALNELYNATIISAVEGRMSSIMCDEWVQLIAGKNLESEEKFKELFSFLQSYRHRIEYRSADIRTPNVRTPDGRNDSTESLEAPPNRRCLIHQHAEHPIWRCRVFLSMSVRERKDIINLSRACPRCLLTSHTIENCDHRFRCNVLDCNSNEHNTLLHVPDA